MSQNRVSNELLLQTILLNPGATDEEIGKKLKLSRVQVSRRKNHPEFRALLQREYDDVLKLFRSYRGRAARKIVELIESKDERIAFRAAGFLLDKSHESSNPNDDDSWDEISARVLKALQSGDD